MSIVGTDNKICTILDRSSVYVVTVTYGNRFHFLKQVIDACINEGVGKIIVVDNNSESGEKLKESEKVLKDKLKVIYLPNNTGSAGGFKVGLEEVSNDKSCQLVLLLDDDNVLCSGSIKKALYLWNYFNEINDFFALSFSRYAWVNDLCTVKLGLPKMRDDNNSFCGFNINRAFRVFSKKYSKKILQKKETLYLVTKAKVAPYGGLFFHKNVISKIGFPNEDFFLYQDDFDYTYRITENGGAIYFCSDINIEDVDCSRVKIMHDMFNENSNEVAIYYAIRNNVFWGKKFITNYLVYGFNMVVWMIYFFVVLYLKNINRVAFHIYKKRVALLLKAIYDGYKANLGKTYIKNGN